MKKFFICSTIFLFISGIFFYELRKNSPKDLSSIREKIYSRLRGDLESKNLKIGAKVFIRIFEEEKILEFWMQEEGKKTFKLFKTYPICHYSGGLGPKLKEGDLQAPEGFYSVTKDKLNPNSRFHLSFNLGFPNALERSLGRTGSFLMIHGGCFSTGCYAMTNELMEEIYYLVEASLNSNDESFSVHSFPFKMSNHRIDKATSHKWYSFWSNLKQGYDWFESKSIPPEVDHDDGVYIFKN